MNPVRMQQQRRELLRLPSITVQQSQDALRSENNRLRYELQRTQQELDETQHEVKRLMEQRTKRSFRTALGQTLGLLVVVAAVAVLISFTALPLLEITGTSMAPTLSSGQYVLALRHSSFQTGDLVAFYSNNKILVKRVIANAGDWVDIDDDGNVSVNGHQLEEPYLAQKAYGNVDIELPFQVPDGAIFVMGDNRAVSLDSRSSAIGCVYEEQMVGKIAMRVWPLSEVGGL